MSTKLGLASDLVEKWNAAVEEKVRFVKVSIVNGAYLIPWRESLFVYLGRQKYRPLRNQFHRLVLLRMTWPCCKAHKSLKLIFLRTSLPVLTQMSG
jgi:hypothetical protein